MLENKNALFRNINVKNIVVGIIMTVFLFINGSVTFILRKRLSHDYEYLKTMQNAISIDFPNNGYISID